MRDSGTYLTAEDLQKLSEEIIKPHYIGGNKSPKPVIFNTKKWYQLDIVRKRIVNFTDEELDGKIDLGERNGIIWLVDVKLPTTERDSKIKKWIKIFRKWLGK